MEMQKPSQHLRASILSSIKAGEYRRARRYVAISVVTLLTSAVGLIFAIRYLFEAFYASEFYSYATLIFSDPDVALSFWNYVALSLAESLPVVAVLAALTSVLVVLASLYVMSKNIKMALTPSFGI